MQIDWLTVAAQMVNFLILVWVLKRVLYKPVLDAMARREQGIASRLSQAEEREQQADARAASYEERVQALEQSREQHLTQMRAEVERERRRLLDEAHEDIEKQRQRWHDEVEREHEELRDTIRHQLAASAVRIAQGALSDLADAALEREVLAGFLRRLHALPDAERKRLGERSDRLRVSTAFKLDAPARERFATELREAVGSQIELDFEQDATLICGATVAGVGHKIGWSIADYLQEAEGRIAALAGEPGKWAAAEG